MEMCGDLVGILEHLSNKVHLSPEEILLQTIYTQHPALFFKLKGIQSLQIFVQLDLQKNEWIRALLQKYGVPNREALIQGILGLH